MFLQFLGRLVALLPEKFVEGLCYACGALLWMTSRGALVRRNMRQAFAGKPGFDEKTINRLAFEACERTIELGVLGLAGQFFGAKRWHRMVAIDPRILEKIKQMDNVDQGVLLLVPHTTLMEALTVLPALVQSRKHISVLYRAFGSAAIEQTILQRRQKHGARLLDRTTGVRTLVRELKAGQFAGMLFDQNSGDKGVLIPFMGRVAAASDLPDIIYRHAKPVSYVLALRRTAFWRGELVVKELREGESLTLQAAHALEEYLSDKKTAADWLWTHKRWKVLDRPAECLGLGNRKVLELPTQKKTKIFIRMPNWLGDVVMALPMLRALRQSRPDAEITLLARSAYLPLLQRLAVAQSFSQSSPGGGEKTNDARMNSPLKGTEFSTGGSVVFKGREIPHIPLADRFLGLPKKASDSFRFCSTLKHENPDVTLALTNSLRGDIEMWLTHARHRFGLLREGYWRPLITHGYFVGKKELAAMHQSHVWEAMFKHFGMTVKVSYAPMCLSPSSENARVFAAAEGKLLGFVPGSANTPEKRYPSRKWRELAKQLNCPIYLFGTPVEQMITSQIAEDLPFVNDLAGKTDMAGLAETLVACRLVIGNDTGAMHLANALGIPTLVIYGPTSPTRTRPIFNSPYHQLKADDGNIGSISVETLYNMTRSILEKISKS